MTDSIFILFILCLNVIICEWLTKKPGFRQIGTALLVILVTAVEANLGAIPTSETPVYEGIFSYIAPFSLFLLLLSVNLKDLRKAGLPMLTMFLIGSSGTIIGVLVSVWAFSAPQTVGSLFYALAGMFTGTYIGGSINFHAVALHYGVSKAGNLFIAATAADNIMTALWMIATLALPVFLQRRFPRQRPIASKDQGTSPAEDLFSDSETMTPNDLALLLALGFGSIFLSKQLAALFPVIPFVLVLTTIALALAQFRVINSLRGSRLLGLFGIYIFLAVIGAYCDIAALIRDGQLAFVLFGMILLLVLIHALIVFGIGALFRQDWDILGIASQANIGGATSALALARSLNRPDLQLPAVLVGTLGNAIGTYLGILVAELLR
ncbi:MULTISPECIES: DUF819 family protein [unclassified Spirosoma]|uniref:DUF819 family protein n=1 Tax=unclassified Spirosoma TaxID=2621999 RepID=UPI000965E8CD|nr:MULTISPECIES: DUF819 family protein [unclassified Spirosoma]MBN8826493.1 DUF819 family protein [Spirosoma sp.]OJW76416.1 MAG: hypothetical protein BGO59_23155 [Spirosoma sp. 48-14]